MAKKAKLAPLHIVEAEPRKLYLDFGCGKRGPEWPIQCDPATFGTTKPEEWEGIDGIDFGQKHVLEVCKENPEWYRENHEYRMGKLAGPPVHERFLPLPWENDSVDGVFSSHFVEHLTKEQRIHFFNELWRIMRLGSVAKIVVPHWSNTCAYGDPTHEWPPMSEWFAFYLNKAWRDVNGPAVGYTCNFDWVYGGMWDQRVAEEVKGRNPEYSQKFVMTAMNTQTNGWRDLLVILTKRA